MTATQATARRTLVQKLGYGQGSLYSVTKADGSTAYVHLYSDNGKQREVRLAATSLSAARKECASRNTKKDEGRLVSPTSITFGEVAEEFLAMQRGLVEEGRRSPRTVALYEQRYRQHLEPALGRRRFQQVTPGHVSGLLSELRGKKGRKGKMSGNTRAGILRLASAIFAFGVSRGYRADSPIQYLASQERPESRPSTKPRALADEECSKLIRATRPGLRDFVAFLAYTGVRLSEGLGLRWGDLDLDEGTVAISAQLERWTQGQAPKLKGLKTENGYRTIDLHPALVGLLKERRRQALASGLHRDDCFVFCTEDGRPLSHRNTARDIEAAAKRAGLNGDGLRPVSAHMLRHTFASRLIALGLDVVEVARQLGDKPDTLLRVYAQAFTDARRREEIRERITQGTRIALG
jgi:integrase